VAGPPVGQNLVSPQVISHCEFTAAGENFARTVHLVSRKGWLNEWHEFPSRELTLIEWRIFGTRVFDTKPLTAAIDQVTRFGCPLLADQRPRVADNFLMG
jgi:hypothetical protein